MSHVHCCDEVDYDAVEKQIADRIREEAVKPLLSLDLRCENFIGRPGKPAERGYDDCIRYGRQIQAEQGADQACWPCVIRALTTPTPAATPEPPGE